MSPTITLTLTPYQARLLKAAVNAEIIKGSHTFLSGRDVINLGHILDLTSLELARVEATHSMETQ
jgi:hypothetical protein